ncbi:MAG: hypothetical protein DMG75_00460 [Acidobacteria bacterium]|nr:MAG: hypothetical protein DMG75_00460 [Acidobacteriota bacterium]
MRVHISPEPQRRRAHSHQKHARHKNTIPGKACSQLKAIQFHELLRLLNFVERKKNGANSNAAPRACEAASLLTI